MDEKRNLKILIYDLTSKIEEVCEVFKYEIQSILNEDIRFKYEITINDKKFDDSKIISRLLLSNHRDPEYLILKIKYEVLKNLMVTVAEF